MSIETTIGLIAIGVVVLGGGWWLYKEREKNDVINSLRPPIILPPTPLPKSIAPKKKAPPVAKYANKAVKKAPAKKAVKKPAAKPASNNVANKRK